MYMMIGVIKKGKNFDNAGFRKWWLEQQIPAAKKLPGLRKFVVYPLKQGFDIEQGGFHDNPERQGLAFLYFDDEAACRAAFSSAAGQSDREHMRESPSEALVFCTDEMIEIPLP